MLRVQGIFFTKMDMLTEYIFRDEDDPILPRVNDDGDLVQPEYYAPIIPMILVNGSLGIGTGWSSSIPCYDPLDLTKAIRTWLDSDWENNEFNDDGEFTNSPFDEFRPWYRGFKGPITSDGVGRWVTKGIINNTKKNIIEVVELPIGMWTNKFKENCEDLVQEKQIKRIEELFVS